MKAHALDAPLADPPPPRDPVDALARLTAVVPPPADPAPVAPPAWLPPDVAQLMLTYGPGDLHPFDIPDVRRLEHLADAAFPVPGARVLVLHESGAVVALEPVREDPALWPVLLQDFVFDRGPVRLDATVTEVLAAWATGELELDWFDPPEGFEPW